MKKAYKSIGILIVFIVLNVIIFATAKHKQGAFWGSYLFIILAFLVFTIIFVFVSDKTGKKMLGYPLEAAAGAYLGLEIFVALIFMLAAYKRTVPAILIQLILFAGFALLFLAGQFINVQIHQKEQARGTDLMNFGYALAKMKLVQQKVEYSAFYRKNVEQAYDSLAGSQVTSTPEVRDLEKEILGKIELLDREVGKRENATGIVDLCKDIVNLSREREMRLKMKSPF